MRRRILASAALLAGSALLLSACAPSGSSGGEQATGDDVTLKVWSWRTEDVEAYNKIFDVFEEEHPGITVEFEAFQNTEYNQILTTGLAGSDGPDVPMVRAYGQLQPNVEAGQLEPIDGDVDGLDAIAPSVIAGAKGKADGKTYAVPLATQTLQMFYNKQIFKEQGLEVPTTWAEFIDVQEKLLAAGITPMALGAKDDWILPIFADIVGSARYGGSEFEQKVLSGETDFNDPDYVASLGIITELQKYLTPDVVGVSYTDSQIQFTSGQAAQFPGGSFEIATFRNQAPDLEFGSYQVPVPDGAVLDAPVSPAYADGNFAINAKSKNKEAALELLNWFATPEFGQLVADELNQFSAIPGVEYEDAVMKEAWANYEDGQAPYLLLVDFRYGEPLGTAVLGAEVQKMFLGQTDAAGAAAALQTGISQWFTPGE
ncbi:ABC transporter substrate-binding protein [Agromyces mediolanus]|uniref:Sugar ABC transporter substrate-binding protein n=1 Tax=Agromyces mediolanus TaxID=41986 RepID=A0A918F6K2_AGRME|nr:extracellular solute-binding protein [Agromyces mediolanus]GGR13444.1 sugar ABC transporter substrate-binding protein [Agromyces mediolanus]GLJ72651.1 sugar ABC transporter substrate-binding protein [Agromyces mediolanus]